MLTQVHLASAGCNWVFDSLADCLNRYPWNMRSVYSTPNPNLDWRDMRDLLTSGSRDGVTDCVYVGMVESPAVPSLEDDLSYLSKMEFAGSLVHDCESRYVWYSVVHPENPFRTDII